MTYVSITLKMYVFLAERKKDFFLKKISSIMFIWFVLSSQGSISTLCKSKGIQSNIYSVPKKTKKRNKKKRPTKSKISMTLSLLSKVAVQDSGSFVPS